MKITKEQQSIFNGLILSDAGLSISKNGINARMSMTSKYRSFIEAMIKNLPFLSWGPINDKYIFDKRTNKSYHSVSVHSHVSEWLTEEYYRWYLNGVKTVPKDIIIDKECLEWWYLGDGHLERKSARPNSRRVILSTDCFSMDNKELLKGKLIKLLGKDVYIECDRVIVVAKNSLVKMANILTHSPVKDYKYKYEFGTYVNSNYHQMAMILRGPVGGRPLGSKDTKQRKKRNKELA